MSAVITREDQSLGMQRTEVLCRKVSFFVCCVCLLKHSGYTEGCFKFCSYKSVSSEPCVMVSAVIEQTLNSVLNI